MDSYLKLFGKWGTERLPTNTVSFLILSNYYCHFHFTGKRWKSYVKIQADHCNVPDRAESRSQDPRVLYQAEGCSEEATVEVVAAHQQRRHTEL